MTGRDDKGMKPAIILALVATGIAVCAPGFAEDSKKSSAGKRFTLVCRAQLLKKTFVVDTDRRTVDGKPANFGEVLITWNGGEAEVARKKGETRPEPKSGVTHELNRLEGTYRSWDEGEAQEKAIAYGCEKAPPPLF